MTHLHEDKIKFLEEIVNQIRYDLNQKTAFLRLLASSNLV